MIAVFDSGIGGISVLREIHHVCPEQSTLYYADQARVPYGPRPEKEVQIFSQEICDYLVDRGAHVIVVACNTATAASINWLRQQYPAVLFVGMEPAIKPAAQLTKTGKIGVLATAGTFKSQRYALLMSRFATDLQLFESGCPGLVEQIEAGHFESEQTTDLLKSFIEPMLEQGIDTLILGCTHYPFVLPTIKSIVGGSVTIIDPAPAVAQQTARLAQSAQKGEAGKLTLHEYVTSGTLCSFISMLNRIESVREHRPHLSENSPINIAITHRLNFYQKVHNN